MSELVLDHVWSDPMKDVSLRASGGLWVMLGDEVDGSGALVELCAGVRAPRRGRVALDAERPSASPRCRRRIASLLPLEAPLVGGGDVRGWLADLALLRGVSPEDVLEASSVRADRPLRSLSAAERRELACWLALTRSDAALVVLHDPLAACGAGQRDRVLERIAELARAAIVVVTTPSIADARLLGGTCQRLDRGLLEPALDSAGVRAAWYGVAGARLTLEADAPRALVAALAREPDVHELRYDEPSGRVLLAADDLGRLARAAARAIVSAGVDIRSLRAGADDLDALRAAASALDDAAGTAYRAARSRGRSALGARPVLGPSTASSERATLPNAALPNAALPNASVPNASVPNASVPNAGAAPGADSEPPGSTPGGSA